jgi:HxlR-like helix-turn-helix
LIPSFGKDRVLLDLIGDKWTVLVFGSLCDPQGRRRFSEIRRDIPGISRVPAIGELKKVSANLAAAGRVAWPRRRFA